MQQNEKKLGNFIHFKNLKSHNEEINNLVLLSNKKYFATCSNDKTIKIYNLTNFEEIISIQEYSFIKNINELKNGKIISCSLDGSFKIIKIFYSNKAYIFDNIIKAHNKCVYKVIELENKKLASCSEDKTIKIWQREKGNYILIRNLQNDVFSILSIKKNILVFGSFENKSITFWDYEKNEIIKELKNIKTNGFINSISLINEFLLGVGGHEFIYLIDIKNYQILINFETISYVYCLIKLSDDTFLTGEDCGKIRNWKLSKDIIILIDTKEKILDNYITSIIQPDDNTLIFCSTSSFNEGIEIYKIDINK